MRNRTAKNLIVVILIFLTNACSAEESVTINKTKLTLNTTACTINNSIKLSLPGSCHYIKISTNKKIDIKYYSDIKSHVIMVVGNTVKNHPDFPLTNSRNDCGSILQAVILSETGEIKLSKPIDYSITCAGTGVNEKDFWILSH